VAGNCIAATSGSRDAGLWLVRDHQTEGTRCPRTDVALPSVELGDIGFYPLGSLQDFHAASIAMLESQLAGVTLPGRSRMVGYHVGARARVAPDCRRDGALMVGRDAEVGRGVTATGGVVIGSGAFIDSNATLSRTIVMPGTYVGRSVELCNAIVDGDTLVRVDLGTITRINDKFLVARAQARARAPWASRLAVGGVLALSLPLWPVAAIAAVLSSPARPLVRRELTGNKGAFISWQFNTANPVLRGLPGLISVAAGHLYFVGSPPRRANAVQGYPTEAPAGLMSAAVIDTSPGASAAERMTSELAFAATRTWKRSLTYFLRGIARLTLARTPSP
jgi:hypothetical protein